MTDPRAVQLAAIAGLLRWTLVLAVVGLALRLLGDVLLTVFAGVLFAVLLRLIAMVVAAVQELQPEEDVRRAA